MSSTSSSSSSTVSRVLLITMVLVAVCTANLATGRASLRPSAGKRSVLVGRTPNHYYQLAAAAAAKRLENELTCNIHTMTVLEARYQQLQEDIEEIIEVMEACQTFRAVNSL